MTPNGTVKHVKSRYVGEPACFSTRALRLRPRCGPLAIKQQSLASDEGTAPAIAAVH